MTKKSVIGSSSSRDSIVKGLKIGGLAAVIIAITVGTVCLQTYSSLKPFKTAPESLLQGDSGGAGDAPDYNQSSQSKASCYLKQKLFEKALPLLEGNTSVYAAKVAGDKTNSDPQGLVNDQCLLCENWQNIGRCHLMIAKNAEVKNDSIGAHESYSLALAAFKNAMPIYYRYGNWYGSHLTEAVHDYAQVLQALQMPRDYEQLKLFAKKNNLQL